MNSLTIYSSLAARKYQNPREINPFSANLTKWSNMLKQLPTNSLSVFNYFVALALKGLIFYGFLGNYKIDTTADISGDKRSQ